MKVCVLLDQEYCVKSRDDGKRYRLSHSAHHESRILNTLAALKHNAVVSCLLDDLSRTVEELLQEEPDVVFNLTEQFRARRKYDAVVADSLEAHGLKFTGADGLALRLSRDKGLSKQIMRDTGLATSNFAIVLLGAEPRSLAIEKLKFPVIVKPLDLDGSDGISRDSFCKTPSEAYDRVRWLHARLCCSAIVEEYIQGREISIAVTDFSEMKVFPPREVVYTSRHRGPRILTNEIKRHGFHDRKSKARFENSRFDKGLLRDLESVCCQAFSALRMRQYARFDLILSPELGPVIFEANPNPCFSPHAFGLIGRTAANKFMKLTEDIVQAAWRAPR